MNRLLRARVVAVLLLGASVLSAVGCSSAPANPAPKTYPAKGQVVSRKTGKPLTGGLVEFETTGNKPVSVQGEIKSDGSFSLITLHNKQRLEGAPEGSYRVSVVPPQAEKQVSAVAVEKVFEVKPDGGNDFKIEVP